MHSDNCILDKAHGVKLQPTPGGITGACWKEDNTTLAEEVGRRRGTGNGHLRLGGKIVVSQDVRAQLGKREGEGS